jgi:anti-sigma regulatory factor (Ser/Thr protein kinase)
VGHSPPTGPGLALDEQLPPAVGSVAAARRAVRRFAADLGVDLYGVELAVSEAVSNAVKHGGGPVELRAAASQFELTVSVRDHGDGIAPRAVKSDGFGLAIMRRLAQHVEIDDSGRGLAVTMRFPRGGRWAA